MSTTPISIICPQAGRAFTLFIRGMFVFTGPHDPLRSTTAAESKQREPPLQING